MKLAEIRKKFLKFFASKKHALIASSTLVPLNDPTVLLTTAGMQQFKPYFLGERDPIKDLRSRRLASVQKCFRTSDINEVGDLTHLTFFEMLGNFSVGDYFKKEGIAYAWEFLTKTLKVPTQRLWATFFKGSPAGKKNKFSADQEAFEHWQKYLPKNKIAGFGPEENFWGPPGKTGPCGPCTEIHYDLTQTPCEKADACLPNCECGRFVEIWNLVFMEYFKSTSGEYSELPHKNIDTGMGLERLAMILQAKASVFQTEAFTKIIQKIETDPRFGLTGNSLEDSRRLRIASDHFKGAVFLRADEVRFSNKEQGYILRRIFRRACDQYLHPGMDLSRPVRAVVREYQEVYPDLANKQAEILADFQKEYLAYEKVRNLNLQVLLKQLPPEGILSQIASPEGVSKIHITGKAAFQLFSTYGASIDQLKQKGFEFAEAEFELEMEKHRTVSRAGAESKFGGHGLNSAALSDVEREKITRLHTATHLLQQALRDVLGETVKQEGSDINPERLRFDFRFAEKLTPEQIAEVEEIVNEKIDGDLPVTFQEMPYADAIKSGALAFFKEKYPDPVKVYSVGDYSKELCGGPHVERTGQIGEFKILSEKSVSAGIRRIKATVA
ncbi:alanine--tRNA ligase [Candidatus Parcubacteria bacterium]|jgi:alanyl-tRNA synthetase|nr:MAG: alanine--tRNA ligase [Candidatus Parcubacteria bacterium]